MEPTKQDINALVKKVNDELLAGEPYNTKVDYKGYVGYEAQYIKDAMNEVFGIGNWGVIELSSEIVDAVQYGATPNKSGVSFLAVSEVEVWIDGVTARPRAYGESNVTTGSVGDARKGARTDAMKKALSDFSIGNRAYLGRLKKDAGNDNNRRPAGNNNQGRAGSGSQTNNTRSAVTTTTSPTSQPATLPASVASQKETLPTVEQLKQEVINLGLDWNKTLVAAYKNVIDDGRMTETRLIQLWAQPEVSSIGINKLWKYIQTLKTEKAVA